MRRNVAAGNPALTRRPGARNTTVLARQAAQQAGGDGFTQDGQSERCLAPHLIAQHVSRALAEDIGPRDWTAELIPANAIGRATVVAREAAVIAGRRGLPSVFVRVDRAAMWVGRVRGRWCLPTPSFVHAGRPGARTADRRALGAELFGKPVSTAADPPLRRRHRRVPARIMDTRKTLPGLVRGAKIRSDGGRRRQSARRAVRRDSDQGKPHPGRWRHPPGTGSGRLPWRRAMSACKSKWKTCKSWPEALDAGARLVLLDNMSLTDMARRCK